jgi:hypothetical protein
MRVERRNSIEKMSTRARFGIGSEAQWRETEIPARLFQCAISTHASSCMQARERASRNEENHG